ncbi:hypothetical protein AOQ84DRAFT_384548 [Glonium stellatum]|uniref:Uncharacterized protein n=1 Tax=Glonium stellatum TaxID=574774 RepID=A0A8E2JZB1_9PEZI|nr:hypothetical protein AOQ84DRAFT_384548 [Glonium stellatum]
MYTQSCGAALFSALMLLLSCTLVSATDTGTNFLNLRTIITAAADTIWAPLNATGVSNVTNFGSIPAIAQSTIGTADLIANVTGSILGSKYSLDVNKAAFINNTTIPMDGIYTNYLDAIPTLSSALTALGKSWHQELNIPIYLAIEALTESVHGFGSSMLQANLITSNSTIRTIQVANTLSDAQAAWSKILNYPGRRRRSAPIVPVRRSTEGEARVIDGAIRRAEDVSQGDVKPASNAQCSEGVPCVNSFKKRRVGTVVGRSIVPWA